MLAVTRARAGRDCDRAWSRGGVIWVVTVCAAVVTAWRAVDSCVNRPDLTVAIIDWAWVRDGLIDGAGELRVSGTSCAVPWSPAC